MSADATMDARTNRATIAQLTLTLRAAEREAEVAEAAEAGWELDAALAQLRSRMAPLVRQRRRVLDDELALEHLKAAEARAAAEIEAAEIIESARAARAANAAAAAAFADVPTTIAPDVDIVVWDDDVVDPADGAVDGESDRTLDEGIAGVEGEPEREPEPAVTPIAADDPATESEAGAVWAGGELPAPVGTPITVDEPETVEPTITVTLDAEAFARAFAAAFGAMMDERLGSMAPPQSQPQWVQVVQPPPAKRSFWTNAWHADVILSLVAALIVVVILIAWST